MSARTILNPTTNTALEGVGTGVLTVENPVWTGNLVTLTTGEGVAGVNFNNRTIQYPSTNSSINFSDFNLDVTCQQGTGSSISLNSAVVNVKSHLSFGPGATPLRIFSGSVVLPVLTPNVPFSIDININTGGAWGGGTPFVNVPNVFVSLQQTGAYDPAVVSGFATGVSNSAFKAIVQCSTVNEAGFYKLIWYAIGN